MRTYIYEHLNVLKDFANKVCFKRFITAFCHNLISAAKHKAVRMVDARFVQATFVNSLPIERSQSVLQIQTKHMRPL